MNLPTALYKIWRRAKEAIEKKMKKHGKFTKGHSFETMEATKIKSQLSIFSLKPTTGTFGENEMKILKTQIETKLLFCLFSVIIETLK